VFVILWLSHDDVGLRPSSNAILRPSSNAILRPSSNAILRPSSNAILRPSSNAILRPSSNAILRPSCNAILRPSSNAILRSFLCSCFDPIVFFATSFDAHAHLWRTTLISLLSHIFVVMIVLHKLRRILCNLITRGSPQLLLTHARHSRCAVVFVLQATAVLGSRLQTAAHPPRLRW
jgi:hypothetical protein